MTWASFTVSRYSHSACSRCNLPKHLPHFRKSGCNILKCLPQICSLLVLCLTAGGLLQCRHDKKATYNQSKHCPVRSYPLPKESKAKPVPHYVKSTMSRPREVFIPLYSAPSGISPLVLKPWKSKRIWRNWRGPSRRLPRSLGLKHVNVEERLKQLGLFKKAKRRLGRELVFEGSQKDNRAALLGSGRQ